MHFFDVSCEWTSGSDPIVRSAGKPDIAFDAPEVFGGEAGRWSPEDLFIASVGTCLMLTLMYFTEQAGVEMLAYSGSSKGTLEKTAQGLRFTFVQAKATVTVPDEEAAEKVRRFAAKAEKHCLVSASLACPVRYEVEANVADSASRRQERSPA